MRIGIEAQRVFRRNKHGMDYVVLQEIKELQQIDHKNEYFVFVAPGVDRCLKDTKNVHIIVIGESFYPVWEQITLPRAVKKYNLDILHCTSNTAPIFCDIPLVLTLHDIIFLEPRDKNNKSIYQNMGWLYRRIVVPRIVKKCIRIITVSNFERNNIISKLNISESKIKMIYNGYNDYYKPEEKNEYILKSYIDKSGYFFHFANTDPRKNTERILYAYSKYLKESIIKRKLLITGINKEQLLDILIKNGIEDISGSVVISGYIPEDDMSTIYNNSFALLFASLREGFGIPILEAMACGTPVITSNTSSMPEIAGNDAILINPESPEEITEKMLRLETDEEYYNAQKEIGLKRAKLFSWRKTAEQLLKLYETVYKELPNSNIS